MTSVLIVDDNESDRIALSTILTRAGYDLIGAARSAEEGLCLFRYMEPEILILDVVMPDMDGIEVLRRVCWEYPDAAVIVCSSITEPHLIELARMTGAKGYITKPVTEQSLLDLLQTLRDESVPDQRAIQQLKQKIRSEN